MYGRLVTRAGWMGLKKSLGVPVRLVSSSERAGLTSVLAPRVVDTIPSMRESRKELKGTVGFVPTLGFLHEGHLSLMEAARKECDHLVVSIYVNSAQFAVHEDFDAYPRDLDRDLKLMEKVSPDVVFCPTQQDMYPPGYNTYVETPIGRPLEGMTRPHFFKGVATICTKLFHIVQPDRAYFGQKDAQQCLVLKKITRDLNFPLDIVIGDTFREDNGLAMSSRNVYLTEHERGVSGALFQALTAAQQAYQNGETDPERLRSIAVDLIRKVPEFKIDYVEVTDANTLLAFPPGTQIGKDGALISLAAWLGKARLIDNMILGGKS